jgi:hypothetical protein
LLEFRKILCCNEYKKPEQNHCRDIRTHSGATLDSVAIVLELREIEHAQDVVGLRIFSWTKGYDISLVVRLTGLHLAPRSGQATLAEF